MNKKRILLQNKAQCRKCGDIITSEYHHDFKSCECGAIHVGGGLEYIKRGSRDDPNDIIELSEYKLLPNKVLFLDDSEERIKSATKYFSGDDYNLTVVETSTRAVELLKAQEFDLVYLHHDLGSSLAQWLCENKIDLNGIAVQSRIYPSSTVMRTELKQAGYNVCDAPLRLWEMYK